MAEHPAADAVPEPDGGDPDVPLTGPASRIYRYLPDGDPKDRAQRYLGEPDSTSRAQRYLSESQIRRVPSSVRPSGATPTPTPAPAPAAPSALHSMVAAALQERRRESNGSTPSAFVAPAPVTPAPAPAPAPAPQPEPVAFEPMPRASVTEPAPPPAPAPEPVAPPARDHASLERAEHEPLTPPLTPAHYDEHGPAVAEAEPGPAPAPHTGDHLARLLELGERLRAGSLSPESLEPVVEVVAAAVGADAVVLTLTIPRREQVTAGSTLGGGPRHAVTVRAEGAMAGELMACRLTDAPPFSDADEQFLSLVADQIGSLVGRSAAGSALEPRDQHFVHTLVAEMRAPLGSVAGMLADFAAGNAGELSEAQQGYLTTAAGQTARLLAIVRDLQTLSRLRRPEAHEMDHIGVGPLLERSAARTRPVADAAGIEIDVQAPAEALVIKGVPEQLDRALHAILDNAVRFSPGGGRVAVSAEIKDGTVRISVADEGIGMDPSDTADVFERFARARTAIDAGIPGVGLGLTIVKEVVDVHGGRAWIESAAGHGTRVHLAIPASA